MSSDDWLKSPYDEICDRLRTATGADAIVVLFIGGKHGSGFEMQVPLEYAEDLPRVLREIADTVEAEVSALKRERK